MAFTYFRFVVTILVGFAPFFAYVCRLNLSLAMNEMVALPATIGPPPAPFDAQIEEPSDLRDLIVQNEEHTQHFLSMARPRSHLSTSKLLKPRDRATNIGDFSSVHFLSIDLSNGIQLSNDTEQPELGTGAQPEVRPARQLLNWSKENQNDLLGAFFLGYVISQVPCGRAAEIFGPKSIFLIVGFGASFCSLIFPWAAKYSDTSIMLPYFIRLLLGMSQGGLFAAAYVFICNWLPESERAVWLAIPATFSRIGSIMMYLIFPWVLRNFDWEWVFYLCGWTCLAWCLIFMVVAANSPASSRWLSRRELLYIRSQMFDPNSVASGQDAPKIATFRNLSTAEPPAFGPPGSPIGTGSFSEPPSGKTVSKLNLVELERRPNSSSLMSWRRIITNKAIMVMALIMFTAEWCNMLLLVKLPDFLGSALKMNVEEIGIWSSLLILVYCVQYPLSGSLASMIEQRQLEGWSSLRIRKLFELAANLLQGGGCLAIALASGERMVVLPALFCMMLGRATVGGGQCLMPPELSKEYPGTVFAYANTLANLAGVFGPILVKLLVEDPADYASWRLLWLISSALFVSIGLAFCLLGDNRPQNLCRRPKPESTTDEPNLEQIVKMDTFSRLARANKPRDAPGRK